MLAGAVEFAKSVTVTHGAFPFFIEPQPCQVLGLARDVR
jgi:hypothetical protein